MEKSEKRNRKVFLSVLGTSQYKPCKYVSSKNNYIAAENPYIQCATLDMLTHEKVWTKEDVCYILLTEGARAKNWVNDGYVDFETKQTINNIGLKQQLEALNLPCKIIPISIPDGKNENEIFEIFNLIYQQIEYDDEVYFDITHSLRYLPMLIMVLCNYSKFMKSAHVKSITYGNWENRDRQKNEADIVDLISLSQLQDWSYAAGNFIENGNANQLVYLSKQATSLMRQEYGSTTTVNAISNLINNLDSLVKELRLCRGKDIYNNKTISVLKDKLSVINESLSLNKESDSPLYPIIDKIANSFDSFSTERQTVYNGFKAAKWCLDHHLEQQALTILKENITSYLCQKIDLDVVELGNRELVDSAVYLLVNHKSIDECKKPSLTNSQQQLNESEQDEIIKCKLDLIDRLMQNAEVVQLVDYIDKINTIRNDINHAGMRQNPQGANDINSEIHRLVQKIDLYFNL